MSYNFDPDRWYERERMRIDRLLDTGAVDRATHERLLADLDRRYEEMVGRIDHTFQLPPRRSR